MAAPTLQLPWPAGQQHRINGGDTYDCGQYHHGRTRFAVDFQFSLGQPVAAVAAGTARRDTRGALGTFVWISHGQGLVSIYAHLSRTTGSFPRKVRQGDTIGGAGGSGGVPVHLHFVMRSGATSYNNGNAYKPEPMSGYTGFGSYGCTSGRVSPMYTSRKPSAPGSSPTGRLERVEGLSNNRVRVTGWAFDPDGKTRPVRIEAWIEGKRGQAGARKVALGYATLTRNDVARVHKGAGSRHGFKTVIGGVAPGKHEVRVYALNRFKGGGTKYLGGKTVRVPTPPADDPLGDDPVDDDPVDDDPVDDDPVGDDVAPPMFRQSEYTWAAGDHFQSFMGDFNGDGQVDVGLRRISDGTFYWRLGPGFQQGQHNWTAGAGPEYQAFMGDFNGDNQVDVGLRRTTDGKFYWRLGPSFSQGLHHWTEAVGDKYQSFMGDFNGDNQVDVGVRRTTDGKFYWRLGPSFSQGLHHWTEAVGDKYQSFMGDFNGDNQVDVGVRRTTDGRFYWRFGPAWSQANYGWADGSHFQSFMGDFNGDNQVDIGLRRTTDGVFYWRLQTPP